MWKQKKGEIRLLLTDLIMPDGVSGVDLARTLEETQPSLRVIYTSGYSQEFAAKDLQLHEGVNFLAKPYYPNKLAQTVRARLDS